MLFISFWIFFNVNTCFSQILREGISDFCNPELAFLSVCSGRYIDVSLRINNGKNPVGQKLYICILAKFLIMTRKHITLSQEQQLLVMKRRNKYLLLVFV